MRAASSARAPTPSFISSTSALSGASHARSDLPRPRRCRSHRSPHGKLCSTAWTSTSWWWVRRTRGSHYRGAGGVSSIAIQLVRALTDLTVVATASRPETRSWVKDLSVHHVIDHGKTTAEQVAALGVGAPGFRVLHHSHGRSPQGDRRADCAPGPARADQQRAARTCIVDAQVRVDPLGIDVHALDDANRRHGGAACTPRQGCTG